MRNAILIGLVMAVGCGAAPSPSSAESLDFGDATATTTIDAEGNMHTMLMPRDAATGLTLDWTAVSRTLRWQAANGQGASAQHAALSAIDQSTMAHAMWTEQNRAKAKARLTSGGDLKPRDLNLEQCNDCQAGESCAYVGWGCVVCVDMDECCNVSAGNITCYEWD